MPLPEDKRQQLDAIVSKMHASGESDENIQTLVNDFKSKYEAAGTPPSQGGEALDFVRGMGDAVYDAGRGLKNTIIHPLDTAVGAVKAQIGEGGKAIDNFRQGRYSEAAGHGVASLLPLLGPLAAQAGEDIGTGDPRSIGRGVTNAAGLLAFPAAETAVGKAKSVIGNVARDIPMRAIRHPITGAAEMLWKKAKTWGEEKGAAPAEAAPKPPAPRGITRADQLGGIDAPEVATAPKPEPPMSAKADAFSMPPSPTAKAFEEMMNQLHPEEDGPLPGNGTYKEPGVKPKAPANFPDSKSKAARGEAGRMSTNDRAVYKREIGKGMSDEEAMNTVLAERKTRGDSIYADKKAAAAARKKPLTGAPK